MDIAESINLLKGLADSSRLMLLNSLMKQPQCVEELARRFNLAASTVSFHLKKMEQVHLVCRTKEQYYVVYRPNPEVFERKLKELVAFENIQSYVQEQRVARYRQGVIKAFFRGDRLIRLPAQRKKRLIILEEFARRFRPGVVYRERDVDHIIEKSYDDYCTIRRELVDERFMTRERENYHRSIHQQ